MHVKARSQALGLIAAGLLFSTPVAADSSSNELSLFEKAESASSPRDRVLLHMQAGLAAFEAGDLDSAKQSFVVAYNTIETIYADNEAAKKARSAWKPEASKDFRGEPYERAQVGYYLGLIDLAQGDYGNARASFKWGMFQDTMSASENYRADMASLAYLRGWVGSCSGASGEGAEDFSEFSSIKPDVPLPLSAQGLLVITEIGHAPRKLGSGQYGEFLSYARGAPSAVRRIEIDNADTPIEAVEVEDLYWQASTLGGRYVDTLLAGKATFKDNLNTTGEVMGAVASVSTQLASISSLNDNNQQAQAMLGLGALSLVGSLIASSAADSVKPAADTRAWDNLSEKINVAAIPFDIAPDTVTVRFLDSQNQAVAVNQAKVLGTGPCSFAWAREVPAGNGIEAAFHAVEVTREEEKARVVKEKKDRAKAHVPSF